eukprot:15089670-Alexandrium_andersonii.AAC.1
MDDRFLDPVHQRVSQGAETAGLTLSTTARMHGITACALCDDVAHATCQLSLAPLHSAPMPAIHRPQ